MTFLPEWTLVCARYFGISTYWDKAIVLKTSGKSREGIDLVLDKKILSTISIRFGKQSWDQDEDTLVSQSAKSLSRHVYCGSYPKRLVARSCESKESKPAN